jgi:hypothetical protein
MGHLPLIDYLLDRKPGFMGRFAVRLIEFLRIGQEGTQAGISTKINRPTMIFGFGEIPGIGVVENPATKAYKTLVPNLKEFCLAGHDSIVLRLEIVGEHIPTHG